MIEEAAGVGDTLMPGSGDPVQRGNGGDVRFERLLPVQKQLVQIAQQGGKAVVVCGGVEQVGEHLLSVAEAMRQVMVPGETGHIVTAEVEAAVNRGEEMGGDVLEAGIF